MRCLVFRRALAALALATGSAAAQDAPRATQGALGRRLSEHVGRAVPFGFSGVVLAARGDSLLLADGYGLAQRGSARAYDAGTVVPIGSIVKIFTRAAIYALASDGRLALTDTLGRFFPALPPDRARITLEQVLTHRAGLPLYTADDDDPLSREEALRRTFGPPLLFAPGTRQAYSNPGYSVLAAIVEDLSGKDLEGFVRERFLVPAGMRETGLRHVAWDTTRLAHAYGPAGRDLGTMLARAGDAPRLSWALHGNGGWLSTAQDMWRWHRALAAGRLLPMEWARRLYQTPDGRQSVEAGGDGVSETAMSYAAADGTFLFASNNAGGPLAGGMVEDLSRLAAGRPVISPPVVAAQKPDGWERLAGAYALAGGGTLTLLARDGELHLSGEGQDALALLGGGLSAEQRALAVRLNARTDSLLRSAAAGDWAPLHRALDTGAPLEEMRDRMQGGRDANAARLGPFRGHRVVGSAPRGTTFGTLVRLDYERGSTYEQYGWDGDRIAGLGVMPRAPSSPLRPTPDGGWASYDLRTRRGLALRASGEGSAARLTITTPDGAVTATRTQETR